MGVHFHTPEELRDLLATVIAGAAGGTTAKWARAIGPVDKLPTWSNVRCNWRVMPRGAAAERALIEQVVAIVRVEHPYVEDEGERTSRRRSTGREHQVQSPV